MVTLEFYKHETITGVRKTKGKINKKRQRLQKSDSERSAQGLQSRERTS